MKTKKTNRRTRTERAALRARREARAALGIGYNETPTPTEARAIRAMVAELRATYTPAAPLDLPEFGTYDQTVPYIAPPDIRYNPTKYAPLAVPVPVLDCTEIDGTKVPFVWIGTGKDRYMVFGRITGTTPLALKEFFKDAPARDPKAPGRPRYHTHQPAPKFRRYLALYTCPNCGGVKEDLDQYDNFDDLRPDTPREDGQYRTRELTTGYDLVENGGVCAACYAEDFQNRHRLAMPGDAEREEAEPLPNWAPTLFSCLDCVRASTPARLKDAKNYFTYTGNCVLQPANATRVNCGFCEPAEIRTKAIQHFPEKIAETPATYCADRFHEEDVNRFWDVRNIPADADEIPEDDTEDAPEPDGIF